MALTGIITGALAAYATALGKTHAPYRESRNRAFAGDAAIEAAINWAREQRKVGIDPLYGPDPCVFRVPSEGGRPAITVTCAAVPGADSGKPGDLGKVPPQALLLLGQRYGELPVYSPCVGSTTDRASDAGREVGLLLDPIEVLSGGASCGAGTNNVDTAQGFVVAGDVNSNAPIRVNRGLFQLKTPNPNPNSPSAQMDEIRTGTSPIFDNGNCIGIGAGFTPSTRTACVRVPTPGGATSGASPWNPGETLFQNPARTGALDASGQNTTAEWRQGVVNWTAPQVAVNSNNAQGLGDGTWVNGACSASQRDVVRFYPGFYTSARALNNVFTSTNCADAVFWFSPDPDGAPGSGVEALRATAKQGVFTFDFRDTGGGLGCKFTSNTDYPHRWCLWDPNTPGPLVVGGTPKGWDPAIYAGSAGSAPVNVSLRYPAEVWEDSCEWKNDGNGASLLPGNAGVLGTQTAAGIDGALARYQPDCIISTDRSIELRRFRQNTANTSDPERLLTAVAPNGRVAMRIAHRENPSGGCIPLIFYNLCGEIDAPRVELRTSENGTPISCGSITLEKRSTLTTDTFTTDDANPSTVTTLRECFRTAERANNTTVKWVVSGNSANIGSPRVYLDGVEFDVQVPVGGFLDAGVPMPAVYCDKDKAGVQFIFGGDSSVAGGNAALQLCAGPPPVNNPDDYQQIAVWGQPTNFLTASGVSSNFKGKIGTTSLTGSVVSTGSSGCWFNSCSWWDTARAGVPNDPYTNPSDRLTPVQASVDPGVNVFGNTRTWIDVGNWGKVRSYADCSVSSDLCYDSNLQEVDRVILKVGYNSNCGLGGTWEPWGCSGSTARHSYQIGTNTNSNDYCDPPEDMLPANRKPAAYIVDVTPCFFGGGPNSTGPVDMNKLNNANMKVRFEFKCNTCVGIDKYVEGVELIVLLKPKQTTTQIVTPLQGCHRAPQGYGSGWGAGWSLIPAWNQSVGGEMNQADTRGLDCALISGGRVSVQGTIYAPDAALEIADGDTLYPFATRGVVARHLRVRKFKYRDGYSAPPVSTALDRTTKDRVVRFTACTRSSPSTQPCGTVTGDRIVTRAQVRFRPDDNLPLSNSSRVRIPVVEWWDSRPTD